MDGLKKKGSPRSTDRVPSLGGPAQSRQTLLIDQLLLSGLNYLRQCRLRVAGRRNVFLQYVKQQAGAPKTTPAEFCSESQSVLLSHAIDKEESKQRGDIPLLQQCEMSSSMGSVMRGCLSACSALSTGTTDTITRSPSCVCICGSTAQFARVAMAA